MDKKFWGLYVGNNRVMITPQYGGLLFAHADDLSLTPALLTQGAFELALTNYLLRTIKAGMTVVDIGANMGYFSVLAAGHVGPTGRLIAFEPNPDLVLLLHDNITVNDLDRQTTVVPKAVSNSGGASAFHVSRRFRGNSSLIAHSEEYRRHYPSDETDEITVESVTFDDFWPTLGIASNIDFVKIDVEGGEYRVLQGMRKSIAAGLIKSLSFELNKDMLQDEAGPLLALLQEFRAKNGARFYPLCEDGSIEERPLEKLFEYGMMPNILMRLGG